MRTKAEARERTRWKTRRAVIVLERGSEGSGDKSGEWPSRLGEEKGGRGWWKAEVEEEERAWCWVEAGSGEGGVKERRGW